MSSAAPIRMPLTTLDDDAWDDLLSFIEERRVIPIVGPEHLQVATERGPRLLYDWLADKLAARSSSCPAMALAQQGRLAESNTVITPVVKLHRDLATRNHDDQWQHMELAAALYAQALSDKPRRAAQLNEAATLVARLPAEMRDLHSVRLWRDRIRAESRVA